MNFLEISFAVNVNNFGNLGDRETLLTREG